MRHGRIALTLSLVVAACLALAPAVAVAARSHGRPGGGAIAPSRPSGIHHGGGFQHRPPQGYHAGGRPFGPRRFVRNVVTFGAFAAPVIYAAPLAYGSAFPYDAGYADPSAYYAPPVSYSPPASYAPAMGGAIALAPSSPPPSTPGVVEFPTGRYVLQGDGTTVPYTWVWIPNPPTAPPGGPPSSSREPSSHGQVYRWTDEAGVAHWTDRLDAVPQQYRAEAQQPRVR